MCFITITLTYEVLDFFPLIEKQYQSGEFAKKVSSFTYSVWHWCVLLILDSCLCIMYIDLNIFSSILSFSFLSWQHSIVKGQHLLHLQCVFFCILSYKTVVCFFFTLFMCKFQWNHNLCVRLFFIELRYVYFIFYLYEQFPIELLVDCFLFSIFSNLQ